LFFIIIVIIVYYSKRNRKRAKIYILQVRQWCVLKGIERKNESKKSDGNTALLSSAGVMHCLVPP